MNDRIGDSVIRVAEKSKVSTETRHLILDAALRLLKLGGYRGMTIDELAKEAGLGKGTVYLYFESKEEIALSVIDRANEILHSNMREIMGMPAPVSVRLARMLSERVMFRYDFVQGFELGLDEMLDVLKPALRQRRSKKFEIEAEIILEALVEGRTRGEFVFQEAGRTARAMILATNGLLPYGLSCQELGRKADVQQRAESVVELLLTAVTAPASAQLPKGNDPSK